MGRFLPAQLMGHATDVFISSVPSGSEKTTARSTKLCLTHFLNLLGSTSMRSWSHATPGEVVSSKARAHLSRVIF